MLEEFFFISPAMAGIGSVKLSNKKWLTYSLLYYIVPRYNLYLSISFEVFNNVFEKNES